MNEEKETIGYGTPAKRIQESFSKVRKKLEVQEGGWRELREFADSEHEKVMKNFQPKLQSPIPSADLFNIETRLLEYWYMMSFIADLGLGVLSVHKRLAKVEKSLDEIKLIIKK